MKMHKRGTILNKLTELDVYYRSSEAADLASEGIFRKSFVHFFSDLY